MSKLLNSGLGQPRWNEEIIKPSRNAISFENENGDIMVFTPQEAKEVLERYIHEELELHSDEVAKQKKSEIEERISFKLKQIENSLLQHVDDKLNKITEKILTLTIDRVVNEEVERRVAEKLKKLKNEL